jgi:hypothetical protein
MQKRVHVTQPTLCGMFIAREAIDIEYSAEAGGGTTCGGRRTLHPDTRINPIMSTGIINERFLFMTFPSPWFF